MSSTPRDLTNEPCATLIPNTDEPFMMDSETTQSKWQPNRVNPLPMTLSQLMQAQKVRRLHRDKLCCHRNQEFLWPVVRDYDMVLILLTWPLHITSLFLWVTGFYGKFGYIFTVCKILCHLVWESLNLRTHFWIPIRIPTSWCSPTLTKPHNYVLD